MKKFYPISLGLFLGILVVAIIASGGMIRGFLSVASVVLVVVPPIVLALGSYSVGELLRCFAVGFSDAPSREELLVAETLFDALGRYLIVSGILGFFIGGIVMLSTLGDETRVASGTALALVTVLYALVFYVAIAVPFRAGIRRKLAQLSVSRDDSLS